jgi:hypothetical protein
MSSHVSAGTRYLVLIYLRPGQRDPLRRCEQRALTVFRRHGGAFERIWRDPELAPPICTRRPLGTTTSVAASVTSMVPPPLGVK